MPPATQAKRHPPEPAARQRTLVLSDLHFGRRTTCAQAPEMLAPLVEGAHRVILLGDIIDHWYTSRPQAAAFVKRIREVCRAAGVKKLVFIRGNHDACLEDAEEFTVLDGILYIHGHAVYHALHGDGGAQTRIQSLNQKKFGPEREASRHGRHVWTLIERVYGAIPMAVLNPIAWPWPVVKRLESLAAEIDPSGGIHSVVLGHSHRPGVRHTKNLTLYNLGGWIRNTRAYAFIRDGAHVKLVHIHNRGHRFHWGETLHESNCATPAIRHAHSARPAR